jgi:hypothetical protein
VIKDDLNVIQFIGWAAEKASCPRSRGACEMAAEMAQVPAEAVAA